MICINYTSGTTGFHKGVMFTHRGACLSALGEMMEHGLNSRSVYLWTVPLFHCNGWCFAWAATAAGARQICQRQVDPKQIVEQILKEGVTHLCGAPVVVGSLTQYCASHGIRFEQGLKIVTAGAPPWPAGGCGGDGIGGPQAPEERRAGQQWPTSRGHVGRA